jgi:hypothetical protein
MQHEHKQQVDSGSTVGPLVPGTVEPDSSSVTTHKNILDKLRERDKPLLASGEPAHGPG